MRLDSYPDHKGRNGIEALASLLGSSDHRAHYRGAWISLHAINVLPQPRRTFEAIPELALDIAGKGQLQPMIVARFGRKGCARYLAVMNRLWHTLFRTRDVHAVRERGKRVYYVLLAGERRYRSLRLLWEEGCAACHEKYSKEPRGTCFHRHLKRWGDKVEVRLCVAISPLPALFLQHSENAHMQVPPHEEAHALAELYRLVRQADGTFTVAELARKVVRSPETVRHAIQFCELPTALQEYVAKGFIPYGIGVELARLHRNGMKRRELEWWTLRAITKHRKVPDFRELVTKYLHRDPNQLDLLGIIAAEEEKLRRRLHIRRTVAAETIHAIWAWIRYFELVRALFEEKKLGLPDSPFSERSPRRVLLTLVEEMEKTLPHFKKLLSVRRYAETSETLGRVRETVWRLNARLDGDKRDASVSHPP